MHNDSMGNWGTDKKKKSGSVVKMCDLPPAVIHED